METRSPDRVRRLLPWLVALALIAASCSASTTVDQTTSTTNSTERTQNQQDEPTPANTEVDAADADTTTDNADTTTAADESTAPSDDSTTTDDSATDDSVPDDSASDDSASDDDSQDTAADTAPSDDGELGIGEARVVVLDPGAEPRTELRLEIAASCTEIMTVTTVQELNQTIGGQAVPGAGRLGNVMEMATSATPVGDNYEIRAEVVGAMAATDTPPALAASINAELSQIVGLTSFMTLTDRAEQIPGSSRVEGAEVLGPMAASLESLNESQSPLPEEAVGVGARWETTSVLGLEGLIITTTVINEVIAIDGTVVELRVTGSQEVDPNSRMTTQGLTGTATLWDITTVGTTIIDLATINPISASLTTEGTQAFDFGPGGELEQDLFTEITTEALPNDGCTGRTKRS